MSILSCFIFPLSTRRQSSNIIFHASLSELNSAQSNFAVASSPFCRKLAIRFFGLLASLARASLVRSVSMSHPLNEFSRIIFSIMVSIVLRCSGAILFRSASLLMIATTNLPRFFVFSDIAPKRSSAPLLLRMFTLSASLSMSICRKDSFVLDDPFFRNAFRSSLEASIH